MVMRYNLAMAMIGFLGLAVAASGAADQPAPATDVPVKRVVLYSSGVGYFEHAGKVVNDGRAELRFRTEQINDMLKSLVLQDLGGGTVGAVVYPSQNPLAKTLKSFQVDISANPSLGELLNQLRGAEVVVEGAGEEITGVILGLEKVEKPVAEGQPVRVWMLNLISGGLIRAVELGGLRRIELVDEQLQAELNGALTALTQARDQDKKPVHIEFRGQGERSVRMGYVIETPIWKTTYRLVMPEDDSDTGYLQGWAIVENQTESDWSDVTLSLVSGRPISFVQDLYQPLYVKRPVVQPELYASLMPQQYDDGLAGGFRGGMGGGLGAARGRGRPNAVAAAPNMEMAETRRAGKAVAAGRDFFEEESELLGDLDAAASVASLASADELGELFQYQVPGVSLPRQRSAMIPIVTDEVAVERLSIYNQGVLAKHPLNGARLKNTTGKFLMQGPITVIDDQAYSGDARIEDLPADQSRLLSYAVDLDVRVTSKRSNKSATIQTGRVVRGVLHLSRKQVRQQDYTVANRADRDKTVLIEHPKHGSFELVDTPEPIETTESLYRFEDRVAGGESSKLTVTEERTYGETVAILNCDLGQLLRYSRSGEIPRKVRDALAEIARRRQALVAVERQIAEREQRIRTITEEQKRIRDNMRTVERNSKYYARLLDKLNAQESAIEKNQLEMDDLRNELDRKRAALEDEINKLNIE
jgi:hypothetical protein